MKPACMNITSWYCFSRFELAEWIYIGSMLGVMWLQHFCSCVSSPEARFAVQSNHGSNWHGKKSYLRSWLWQTAGSALSSLCNFYTSSAGSEHCGACLTQYLLLKGGKELEKYKGSMFPQVALAVPKHHPAKACGELVVQMGSALQGHIL